MANEFLSVSAIVSIRTKRRRASSRAWADAPAKQHNDGCGRI